KGSSGFAPVAASSSAPFFDFLEVRDSVGSSEVVAINGDAPGKLVRIENATIEDNSGIGLYITGSTSVRVADSRFLNHTSLGVYVVSSANLVELIRITSAENSSVGVEIGGRVNLTNSIIADNGSTGLQLDGAQIRIVSGNVIRGNATAV